MKKAPLTKAIITLWLLLCITFPFQQTNAQARWEVNMLRNINPTNPSSEVWKGFSSTAKPLSIAIPAGLLTAAILNKDASTKEKAIEIAGSIFIAAASTAIIKPIVNRERPGVTYTDIYPDKPDQGNSFPSGHVSVSFAAAASLSIQYKKWYITVPAYAWGLGVAYSRMYLGQHYPSDVLMGAATGIGSAYLSHWLNKKLFPKKHNDSKPHL